MSRIAILGSTGSIGVQAIEVIEAHPDRVRIAGLAAGRSLDALCEQARRFRPGTLALEHAADPGAARARLAEAAPGAAIEVGPGAAARMVAGCACDTVLNGIVGAAGLAASLATLERGLRLALANKETLVVGGPLVAAALARGGELIPVDSEHSAALQCLGGRPPAEVECLTLTASGGALRGHRDWRRATREEVLAHPVWSMGPRITVDSATLFNKGLELIEAHWLFGLDWGQLDAVLHPEARIHALVRFVDGSSVAQAAAADMRLPIALGLSWPAHWPRSAPQPPGMAAVDLAGLTFSPIPAGRHPAFDLARAAGVSGGTAPCALNAADEVAVEAFLSGRIALGRVPEVIAAVLDGHRVERVESLAQLVAVDARARADARAAAEKVMTTR